MLPGLAVICRYTSSAEIKHLLRWKRAGVKVIYFMDDDLMDPLAWDGLAMRYRWKLYSEAYRFKKRLFAMVDEFWVSTPYLVEKYAWQQPVLVPPVRSESTAAIFQKPLVQVCYHGTASHAKELQWLFPVMGEVLSRNETIHFELFGDARVARQYRQLPRTSVLHPMPWQQYLAYTKSRRADIGLAPLLPSPFNAGRAATKILDYDRMGAVGIYSNGPPYHGCIEHGVNGWLLPNEQAQWVAAIELLALNTALRQGMLKKHAGPLT